MAPNDRRTDWDHTPEGEGFQRRGWREGSDYYGNDPERYGAGNYDRFADDPGYDESFTGEGYRGRGPRGYARSDERIREDACELLTDEPRVDASNVEVTVQDGEITLSGTVSTREQKRIAEDLLAENVSGVKDVRNQLRVTAAEGSSGIGGEVGGGISSEGSPSPRH